ncbi:MAG: serine hydrolase domain-containing protein, partial [Terriglobales bacterium]
DSFKNEILEADLVLDNNKQMKYSNAAYALLGVVIECVSGKTFKDYVNEKIIQPLGLKDTGPDFTEKVLSEIVTGYSRRELNKQRVPITEHLETRAMASAGGVYSTAADMCTYFGAHFVGSGKLLNDESKKEMQRTQWPIHNAVEKEEYALGFEINHIADRRFFGHGGGFPGQLTKTLCDPNEQLISVVLTNCIDAEPTPMSKGVINIIEHFKQSADKADSGTIEELKKFHGTFMALWGAIMIVEDGNQLIAVNPDSWNPFAADMAPQTLERIDDQTLKVVKANGFYSEGEQIKYEFDKSGVAKSIRYAGNDMWPEEEFKRNLTKLQSEKSLAASPS